MRKLIVIRDYYYTGASRKSFLGSAFNRNFWDGIDKSPFFEKIEILAKYKNRFRAIAVDSGGDCDPFWNNGWLPPMDAASLYGFLAERNPRWFVECGSGNTTKFAARAIRDNGLRTKIISIDPQPRAEVDALCDEVFRVPFEEMDLAFFYELTNEDVFLIDNSHRSFPGSDVTVFFTEVLPILPSGILYALHDIFLPYDYPEEWDKQHRLYNEQYLLQTYLQGGANGDAVFFPCQFIANDRELRGFIDTKFNVPEEKLPCTIGGGSLFWMKKGSSLQ
jgi:hypothetical protein